MKHRTGIVLPAVKQRGKRVVWRQLSFNLADGCAACEVNNHAIQKQGAESVNARGSSGQIVESAKIRGPRVRKARPKARHEAVAGARQA